MLNNKPGASSSTREKILKIAQDMHYNFPRSNDFRSVRKGTIRFLKIAKHGHTVNRDHDVFIADYIEGLDQEARRTGHTLEINSCNFVDMNNMDSLYQIVKYFVENGHREIGFIRTPIEVNNFRQREIGIKQAAKCFGLTYNEKYVYSVDSTFDGAYRDMRVLLKKGAKLPTALFSSNDIIAYGCIKAIKEAGYRVPEDVSIIGFDDLPLSAVMDPPLTTMEVSKKHIGELAMRLMSNMLEVDPGMPPVKITICGRLICRKSVKNLHEAG